VPERVAGPRQLQSTTGGATRSMGNVDDSYELDTPMDAQEARKK